MTTEREYAVPTSALVMLVVLGVAAVVVWWPGCRTYPVVPSATGQRLIQHLYTACNTKNPERLAAVEERLNQAVAAGEVGADEEKAFRRVIDRARRGDWERAAAEALKFAEDQVGRGQRPR